MKHTGFDDFISRQCFTTVADVMVLMVGQLLFGRREAYIANGKKPNKGKHASEYNSERASERASN